METIVVIISILLLGFASGYIPPFQKYNVSHEKMFYLILIIFIFLRVCIHYAFRRKSNEYGYNSIGGWRGYVS